MAWDYQYQADGEDLLDYATMVVIRTEYGLAEITDTDFPRVGSHGSVYIPNNMYGPGQASIAFVIRETAPDGTVTHVNGKAGHTYENLSSLKRLFGKTYAPIVLSRVAPHEGAVQLLCKPAGSPSEGVNRFQLIFPLKVPSPFWRSATATGPSGLSTGNFNPGGSAPVDDMVLAFSGVGDVQNSLNGSGIAVTAATTLDGGARTSTAGPGLVIPNDERWLHLEGGVDNPLVVTGSVTITYRTKWK